MKYVMFTNIRTGLKLPSFFPDYFCHCDMVNKDINWVPTSAGDFCARTMKTFGYSDTLKLGPAADDAQVCALVLADLMSVIHFHQDPEANLRYAMVVLKQRLNRVGKKQRRPRRKIPKMAMISDVSNPKPHTWEKQNLVTETDGVRYYDRLKCKDCGITGKRFGLDDVTIDPGMPSGNCRQSTALVKVDS
jgi:hypothetical protein